MRDDRVEAALGERPTSWRALHGGCIGEVYRVSFSRHPDVVAKVGAGNLDIEARMLRRLAPNLPVPEVLHADPDLLLMAWVPGSSHFSTAAETHAAELLAQLHSVTADRYGLEFDGLIGGLPQPSAWHEDWLAFFGDRRLRHMALEAERVGHLSASVRRRVEQVADRLGDWIEPAPPALLHGDVWTTNVLAKGDRITAFLDPAVYFGDPEVELAFIGLFGTFGQAFYRRYDAIVGIRPGFFEVRRDLYNLYPLLVHARLFGGGYGASVDRIARQLLRS